MEKVILYIHGKNGKADEAEHYKSLFKDCDVIGFDYKSKTPWECKDEFLKEYHKLKKQYKSIIIIANSIGAFFSMEAFSNAEIEKAWFISPIVDMEKLILKMMGWAKVSEKQLEVQKTIETKFGETLSWDYLCYVRKNKIEWDIPTEILYGAKDNLTSLETITEFSDTHNANLTIMPNGEHWFHTKEQMQFLDKWIIEPNEDPFDKYLRQTEPDKREKTYAWHTAVGLQAVDSLKPSQYLIDTAIKNIEGKITLNEAQDLLNTYYKENRKHTLNDRTEEADKVSLRIAQILSEKSFSFTPNEYLSIHRKLFSNIYKHAGKIRENNITKKEWILDGETVLYGSASELKATLEYDLLQEQNFSYKGLSIEETIHHLAVFISRLWQIHVFAEGNTRTTAVFFIKYLRKLGFNVKNDIFAKNSWYFRNALVRGNYSNLKKGIHETTEYLELFLRNLLLDEKHSLHNRNLHISNILSVTRKDDPINDPINDPIKLNKWEQAIYNELLVDATLTRKELSEKINCSEVTIKRALATLVEKRIIKRSGANKNGFWLILRKMR